MTPSQGQNEVARLNRLGIAAILQAAQSEESHPAASPPLPAPKTAVPQQQKLPQVAKMEQAAGVEINPKDVVAWLITQPNANGTLYLEKIARRDSPSLRSALSGPAFIQPSMRSPLAFWGKQGTLL